MVKKITNLLLKLTEHKFVASSIWSIIIIYLSLGRMPSAEELPFKLPFIDKLAHLTMYFILGTLLMFEFRLSHFTNLNIVIIGYTVVFGLAMEVFQSMIFTYRTGSILDFLFNILGSALAYVFFRYYSVIKEK